MTEVEITTDEALALDLRAGLDAAAAACANLIERVLAEEGSADAGLTVLLTTEDRLQALNRDHRGRDEPTDVLSFPAELWDEDGPSGPADLNEDAGYLGDIAVSVALARRQADEAGLDFELELQHLVLHGVLHLLGYDHETAEETAQMERCEEELLGSAIHAATDGVSHSDG